MTSLLKDHKLEKNKTKTENGFSLLEIVIVLTIIGAIMGVALPRLMDKQQVTRKFFREFVVAGKDLRNRAKLSNSTYRLAFRLDENQQAWWVEKASGAVLLDKEAMAKARENEGSSFKDDEKPPPKFQIDKSIFKKEQTLPDGFRFVHIESAAQDYTATEGMAYIHFFPQGLIETSSIQIQDAKKNIWTLVFNPITGQSDIIPEARTLKDLAR